MWMGRSRRLKEAHPADEGVEHALEQAGELREDIAGADQDVEDSEDAHAGGGRRRDVAVTNGRNRDRG